MSAIYPAPPLHQEPLYQLSQQRDQNPKVERAAKTIFQRVKEAAAWVWRAIVLSVAVAGEKISIVVFRILNWIHPSIGPQIEIIYLRVMGVIDAVRNGWKQQEMKEELDTLRRSNEDMRVKMNTQAPWVENYGRLFRENGDLRCANQRLEEANRFLKEGGEGTLKRNDLLVAERTLVEQREAALKMKNQTLSQQQSALRAERETLKAKVDELARLLKEAEAVNAGLREKFKLQEQSAPYLQNHHKTSQAIAAALTRLPETEEGRETSGRDDILNRLLPLLLTQLKNVQTSLGVAKVKFSSDTPEQMVLLSAERILRDIVQNLGKIPVYTETTQGEA